MILSEFSLLIIAKTTLSMVRRGNVTLEGVRASMQQNKGAGAHHEDRKQIKSIVEQSPILYENKWCVII